MTALQKLIAEIKDATGKEIHPLPWTNYRFEGDEWRHKLRIKDSTGYDFIQVEVAGLPTVEFILSAVNNIEKLALACEVMMGALETMSKRRAATIFIEDADHVEGHHLPIHEAFKQVEKILGEG